MLLLENDKVEVSHKLHQHKSGPKCCVIDKYHFMLGTKPTYICKVHLTSLLSFVKFLHHSFAVGAPFASLSKGQRDQMRLIGRQIS